MTYGLREIDGVGVELCDECGFDGRGVIDLRARLAAGYQSLATLCQASGADQRPEAETWSGVEYGDHLLDVTPNLLRDCDDALARSPADRPLSDLADAATVVDEHLTSLTPTDWDAAVPGWPFAMTVRTTFIHLLHDLEHHVLDVRRGLAKLALASSTEIVTVRPERSEGDVPAG